MKNNIVLIGMPGSGKTTVGKILGEKLRLKFYDMDDYIEKKTSKTIAQLFENGEESFREIETTVCRELSQKENVLISTGGGVVKRQENIEVLKKNAFVIFLDRPIDLILNDVDISKRPLLKEGKEKVIRLYEERYDLYKKAADKIVENDSELDTIVQKIKNIIFNEINLNI